MPENNHQLGSPVYLKVEPSRPVIARMVKERPPRKKVENKDDKLISNIVAGIHLGNSFAGGDFGSLDLSGKELYKGMFPRAKLSGSDFSNSDLSGSNFQKANLANADFSGAILKNVDFKGADLTGVDFSNANLEGANLSGAILKDATICNTDLTDVIMTDTVREELQRIREAMLEIDLAQVDLRKVNLRQIDFRYVDLRGIDLTGIDLSGINLVGVNLSGAKIDFSKIDGSHFLRAGENSKVKISRGNLAGLDPLTVHMIQTENQQKKEAKNLELKEEDERAIKNNKRPPYKVKEEDYVKSKYDFPDIHTKIMEREANKEKADNDMKSEQENASDKENIVTRKLRRFFPKRLGNKRDGKIKVRN